jgi:hypothetical protein
MKLYGAMDLHSNNNVTVLIDDNDQVVCQKRLANDLGLIGEQLSPYAIIDRRDRSRVASGAMTFSSASLIPRRFGSINLSSKLDRIMTTDSYSRPPLGVSL